MKRISFFCILVFLTIPAVSPVYSQTVGDPSSAGSSESQPKTEIPIWPGKAPGSEDWTFSERVMEGPGGSKTYSNVVNPTLSLYLPGAAKSNGVAIILCPGGAMRMLGFAEPERTAEWLNSKGIAAFILKYRVVPDTPPDAGSARSSGPPKSKVPGKKMIMGMGNELSFREILNRNGNANPAPDNQEHLKVIRMAIADGQQAIRVLRRDSAKYNIDPKRIGILGFSAGGGVAIGTAVTESEDAYPDFVATIYGPSLVDVNVPQEGAPLFIAVMDGHFNVTNGCAVLFALWKEAGRPVEMHVYDHAYGPPSGMPVSTWTDRLYDWLLARKLVTE
ncbi:MAG: alpha/beta hydrolase fold domain-containing protein [Acidobacteriota bacterium]